MKSISAYYISNQLNLSGAVFYSILAIAAIGLAIYGHKRWQKLPKDKRKGFSQKTILWTVAGLILILVLAGRAHWLMGVLAALLALVGRVAQFAQYVPLFKQVFGEKGQQQGQANGSAPVQTAMSRQQAADILGVDINAEKEEIRLAHKKLMQKIHPDRGGSDALAKQINQAKDTLIG